MSAKTIQTATQTPFHQHDCSECKYLGSEAHESDNFDYYFHEQKSEVIDLIARYGVNEKYICSDPIHVRSSSPAYRAKELYEQI